MLVHCHPAKSIKLGLIESHGSPVLNEPNVQGNSDECLAKYYPYTVPSLDGGPNTGEEISKAISLLLWTDQMNVPEIWGGVSKGHLFKSSVDKKNAQSALTITEFCVNIHPIQAA